LIREAPDFAAFYDRHFVPLLRHLTRRTYDPEVGLDLTAETFAQAYLARSKFRGSTESEAAAWLQTIANRQLARYFKKGFAEQRALQRLELERPALDDERIQEIERLAGLAEVRARLQDELGGLSESSREAVRLRIVHELPFHEVASQLGISEAAARARVSRALRGLAKSMTTVKSTTEATR